MKLDLSGRRAVVTGGSRGIGLATAIAFAQAGADVSICARKPEGLEKARAALADIGSGIVHAEVCDVADAGSVARYVEAAAQTLGGIDILVNNVTGGGTGNTEADWLKSVNVDIIGTVQVTKAAQPFLEAGGSSSIINVASRAAFGPSPRGQAYAAAKAAVMHLTTSQAAEMARKGVRVNCVAPGSTEFPGGFWDRMRTRNPELHDKTAASFPFGRFGREEDIAGVMLFLASPLGSWITGQTILVDGGQTLGA
jgi:3-oxoacyl-[acyl-carrier protein] reductase